jgi:hypothetical protein
MPALGRLFEQGQIVLSAGPVKVHAGMPVLTGEGQPVGYVIAIMTDAETRRSTHLLFAAPLPPPVYRLVSLADISQVAAGQVWLALAQADIEHLPVYHIQVPEGDYGHHST